MSLLRESETSFDRITWLLRSRRKSKQEVIVLQKGFKTVTVLALVLMLTIPAFAAETTDKIGLGVRGGLFLSGGEWKLGPMGGAEVKFGIHKHWALGLVGTYCPTKGGMLDLAGDLPMMVSADEDNDKLRIKHYIFIVYITDCIEYIVTIPVKTVNFNSRVVQNCKFTCTEEWKITG